MPREDREPWERQHRETHKAFEAFQIYRSLGVKRSMRLVAKQLGKSEALMHRWSSKYRWVERAAAWDFEQDRILREENNEAIRAMTKRHTNVAMMALQQVVAKLQKMIDPETGQPIEDNLTATQAAQWMDLAVKVERLSRGVPSSTVEVSGNPERPMETRTEVIFVGADEDPTD